jgi:hypothetical protein
VYIRVYGYGMSHGGTGGTGQVGEPGPGHDQHQRGAPDAGGGGAGAPELGDPRGAELARRGEVASRRDEQAPEVEVVLAPDQPAFPGAPVNVVLRVVGLSPSDYGLPAAAELAEYNRVAPGLAQQIVGQAFANMDSDRKNNELEIRTAATLDKWGLGIAGGLSYTCIACAMVCLFLLHPVGLALGGAAVFGLASTAPVIKAFVERRASKDADDDKSAPTPPPGGN